MTLTVKQKPVKELSVPLTRNVPMKVFLQIVSRLLKVPQNRLTVLDCKNVVVDENKNLINYQPKFVVEVKAGALPLEKTPSYQLINNPKIRNLLLLYMTMGEDILGHIWSLFKIFPVDQELQAKLTNLKVKDSNTPEKEWANYIGIDYSVPSLLYFLRALNRVESLDYDACVKHSIFKLFISMLVDLKLNFLPAFSYLKTLTQLFRVLARFIQTYRMHCTETDDLSTIANMAIGIIYPTDSLDTFDGKVQHLYAKFVGSVFKYIYSLSLTGKNSLSSFKMNLKFTPLITNCTLPPHQ